MKVVGIDTTNRFPIFSAFLMRDMVYFVIAMVLILIIMGMYLRSALITLFTLLDVVFSFGLAYFLYFLVFQIPHMPFMGFLAILLLIAIGADDVFIFYDTFDQMKAKFPDAGLDVWISETMGHAALSILVTSLTTGAALYANVISEITDIRGFGIISGTALVVNYILMITWIPAGIVLIEKFDAKFCSDKNCCECFEKFNDFLKSVSVKIFHEFLPLCIEKLSFIWLFLFLGLGIGGIVITFGTPKLDLPTSKDFALFKRDSTIEVWFLNLKYKFRYYQLERGEGSGKGMPLSALWGIGDSDTGNQMDPDSIGDLEFDTTFNLSDPEAQTWMLNFCLSLKNSSIAAQKYMENKACAMELFNSLVKTECIILERTLNIDVEGMKLSTCCGYTTVPIPPSAFDRCYAFFTSYLAQNGHKEEDILGYAYFDTLSHRIKAYRIDFVGRQRFSSNFAVMDPYYKEVQDWMDQKLATVPKSLHNGWISASYGSFELYDLQRALASGTYASIGVSMAVAFIVMLITSLNVLITTYAVVTIFLTISVSAGVLVLLGWELNVVESVTLTMSVGLSIDFCIHYGMGYRLSTLGNRKLRVQDSFERVGAAIFMAAATTFLAGVCIIPSIILFYIQLGTFLMLVMAVSWLFATFFFQSLCYVLGPTDDFCQIPSPFKLCQKDEGTGQVFPNPEENDNKPQDENVVQTIDVNSPSCGKSTLEQ